MHIPAGGGAAERLKEQQAAQLQAVQNAVSAGTANSAATGADPFPSLLQASPASSAAPASSADPQSLSALLATQEQNGTADLAGNLAALDKLLSGIIGSAAGSSQPGLSATA